MEDQPDQRGAMHIPPSNTKIVLYAVIVVVLLVGGLYLYLFYNASNIVDDETTTVDIAYTTVEFHYVIRVTDGKVRASETDAAPPNGAAADRLAGGSASRFFKNFKSLAK